MQCPSSSCQPWIIFDINQNPARNFAVALGSSETTLLKLSNAYAMLVNGGKKITPFFIDRIQDRNGITIRKRDNRECLNCKVTKFKKGDVPPFLFDETASPLNK